MIREPEVMLKMIGFVFAYFQIPDMLGFIFGFFQAATGTDFASLLPYFDNVGTIVVLMLGLRHFMTAASKSQQTHIEQMEEKEQRHKQAIDKKEAEFSSKWKDQEQRHTAALKQLEERHANAMKDLRQHYTDLFKAQQTLLANSGDNT